MIGTAALIGALCGAIIVWAMDRNGMLAERSGAAMLLAAIASFYPVFAVMSGDPLAIGLHSVVFLAFAALAMRAYHRGLHLIAGGLIGHGLFDIVAGFVNAPGPIWWPAFCAAVDIVAGLSILRLIQTGRATQ